MAFNNCRGLTRVGLSESDSTSFVLFGNSGTQLLSLWTVFWTIANERARVCLSLALLSIRFRLGFATIFLFLPSSCSCWAYWHQIRKTSQASKKPNCPQHPWQRANPSHPASLVKSVPTHDWRPDMKLKSLFSSDIFLMSSIKELNSFTYSLTVPVCFNFLSESLATHAVLQGRN